MVRGRHRPDTWVPHDARTDRWRARAPIGPSEARFTYSRPNQPVPPSRPPRRYEGPQSRSYADVTRQNTGRHVQQLRGSRQTRHTQNQVSNRERTVVRNEYRPADPALRQLIKDLHQVIKLVHHLQNVAPRPGKPEPPTITRMVATLSSLVKPARPTLRTQDLITGNAKNWGYATLQILEEHYTAVLDKVLDDLSVSLPEEWEFAFQVATRWAYKNLPKLTQKELEHAEALISTCGEPQEPAPPSPTTHDMQTHNTDTHTAQLHTSTQREGPLGTTQCLPLLRDLSSQMPVPNLTPLPQRPTRTQRRQSHFFPTIPEEEEEVSPLPGGAGVPPQTSTPVRTTPVPPQNVTPHTPPMPQLTTAQNEEDIEDLVYRDPTPLLHPVRSPQNSGTTEDIPQNSGATANVSSHTHQSQQTFQETTFGPEGSHVTDDEMMSVVWSPTKSRVTNHGTSKRKMIDWKLHTNKKWVIMGDSNLRRFPQYSIPDLQIDSYPGATFRHATALISKTTPNKDVEKIVLAFGINNRQQKGKETCIKQLQAAICNAKRRFPYAEVWVPLVNYSRRLPYDQQVTLQTLNAHISRHTGCIPALDKDLFTTDTDDIHWTRTTAKAMLDHWVSFLNFNAP